MSRVLVSCAAALMLAGCTTGNAERRMPSPAVADVHAPIARAVYRPVLAGYEHHTPIEPRDWTQMNRRVAPPGSLPPEGAP